MIEMRRAYARVEKGTGMAVAQLVASLGVPSSLAEADAFAEALYPSIMERRREIWAREAELLLREHPGLELKEPRFYPMEAVQKLVRRSVGLEPKAPLARIELFDEATQAMAIRSVAPWTMPDDPAMVKVVAERMGVGASRHIKQASRDLVRDTAFANGGGYARVLSGAENCQFCAMLASRGPVYSKDTATRRKDGSRYHDHCDCTAVLVMPGKPWQGEETYLQLQDYWQKNKSMKGYADEIQIPTT